MEKRGVLTNPKLMVIVEGYTEGCYSSVAVQVALWAADVADRGGDIFGVDLGERSWREDDPLEPLLGPIKRF